MQCTVLPSEMSLRIRKAQAVTEAVVFPCNRREGKLPDFNQKSPFLISQADFLLMFEFVLLFDFKNVLFTKFHAMSSKSEITTAVSKPPIFVSEAWRLMPV